MASQSQTHFFGRAWQISINSQANGPLTISQSSWEPEGLRITFDIEEYAMQAYWYADVTIWNLNRGQQQALLTSGVPAGALPTGGDTWTYNDKIIQGDTLSISAGYQYNFNPASSLLFKGAVLQPMWSRENVVDWKITLRCVVGLLQDADQSVNFPVGAGVTQAAIVAMICDQAHMNQDNIDTAALSGTTARGQTIYGKPIEVLSEIADENNLQMWISPNGLSMRSLAFSKADNPDVIYAPPLVPGTPAATGAINSKVKYTLIGVPQQTQEGVIFTVLLDAEPKIGSIVQLQTGTAINQLPRTIGVLPGILDPNGVYVVCGIRHTGDTRGNPWYTEITALTWNWGQLRLESSQP